MKVHQLKLTIQDVPDKTGKLFAAVFGTVIVDTGELAKNEDGTEKLDEAGEKIPVLENIDTIVPLNSNPQFRSHIQAFLVEAITLKNLEVAEKNGQVSHFLRSIGDGEGAMKAEAKAAKRDGKRAAKKEFNKKAKENTKRAKKK